MTTIILKNAKVTISAVKVENGWQVQSHLSADNGQQSTSYGKAYKSQKRAEREAAAWVKFQTQGATQ